MKPYPKYEDSGVEWIGAVPEGWEVKKLKYLTSKIGSGVTPKGGANVYQLSGIPFLRSQNIHFGGLRLEDVAYISEKIHESMSGSKVIGGDVLLNITGASIGRCCIVGSKFGEANVNQHVCIVRPKSEFEGRYLNFFIQSVSGQTQIELGQTGGGREGLNFEVLSRFLIPSFGYKEQTTIANYLDHKTAEIDLLIANKERLIELYEEEKSAVINQVVTKGLDPDVPMKSSGIDWLGDIPEHWEVKRLKYMGKIRYGLGQPPKEKTDGLPIIRATNIFRGKIDTTDLVFVDPEDVPYERDPILQENDIVVVRSGAYTADSAIILKEFEGAVAGYDMVIRCFSNYFPRFLSFCLLSDYVLKRQLLLHSLRAAQPHLNREELGETLILVPKEDEKGSIVHHIETQCTRLDTIIDKFKKQIELLKEYRTTLISKVVTGKIDVRNEGF